MAPSPDLVVVVRHGNYHTPAPFAPLIEALKVAGAEAYCPQLSTSDPARLNVVVNDATTLDFDRDPPTGGYPRAGEDVGVTLRLLNSLIDERGKKVLLVAHAAAGWVATEAARPHLLARTRKSQGLEGGVVGILYMCAFVIPIGQSVHEFFQPKDGFVVIPPWLTLHENGLGTPLEPEKFMFSDLEPALAQKWAKTLTASPGAMTAKLTNDPYADLPCAYLVCEGDQVLSREFQEGMVALQSGKPGPPFTVYRCPAGRSPHLSYTRGVVETVTDFVKKFGD